MNARETHRAISWFIAGYIASNPGEGIEREDIEESMREAESILRIHRKGGCILCEREGIVLLDGYFCERCYPGIEEEFDL